MLLFGEAALIGLTGAVVGAGLALWWFGKSVQLGAVTGFLGYMQVRPETGAAAIAAALAVSIASAIVPIMNAMRGAPAMAFRQVV